MATILVIDDEPGIRSTVRDILEDEGHTVIVAEDAIVGLEAMDIQRPDLAVLDVWLPRMGGLDALAEMKRRRPEMEILIVSGHGTIDMAVRALKLGAFDFIEKPLSMDRMLTAVRNALEIGELRRENRDLKRASSSIESEPLIGSSAALAEVRALIDQAAPSDARILITGENGTGKELIAKSIHAKGKRSGRPFIEVNCAAIPDSSKASFSAMKRAPSPTRSRGGLADSKLPTVAPSSSTKSPTCHCLPRPKCCASSRKCASSASAARRPSPSTFA